MRHCEPETLSLMAMGEPVAPVDAEHVSTCKECRADVASLARVVSAMMVHVPDGPPIPPPQHVWERIVTATRVPADTGIPPAHTGTSPGVVLPFEARSLVRRSEPSRGPARKLMLAVAASALVVGGIGGSLLTRLMTGRDPVPSPVVVTQTQLVAVPKAPSGAGRASVVMTADGGERLIVGVSDLKTLDGPFYEVWLIDKSVKKMVAVGILGGAEGQFVLPPGINLHDYPVVDISIQEVGNPTHSGNSVLRGTLPA
jgi:Anti-sigma-K factor rskA